MGNVKAEFLPVVALVVFLVGVFLGAFCYRLIHRLPKRPAEVTHHDDTAISELDALRRVSAIAPFGIAIVDRAHNVILTNDQAYLLGVVRKRQLHEKLIPSVEDVFSTQETVSVRVRPKGLYRNGRSVEHILVTVKPLVENNSQFVAVYCIDATEEARLEKTRRDFVANVSHELKTPVGAIAVLAEALMADMSDTEQVAHFAERLNMEAMRLSQLITELIELSRLQGAEKLPDPTTVELDSVVAEALARCAHSREKYQVSVRMDDHKGFLVSGDHALMVTALTNLLENAIRYSEAGS